MSATDTSESPRSWWQPAQEVAAVLRPAWLALLIVAAMTTVLQVAQARDVLTDISGKGFVSGSHFSLFVALVVFAICGWYFPRALLYVRYWFTPPERPFFERWRRWFPRVLGVLPIVSTTVVFLRAGAFGFALFYVLVGTALVLFLVFRRTKLFLGHEPTVYLHSRMPTPTFRFVVFLVALSFGLLCAFLIWPVGAPRKIGPLSIVLYAMASWLAVGCLLLVYPTYRYRWPPLVLGAFLLAALFSLWNDNHQVRTMSEESDPPWERPSVAGHLEPWLEPRLAQWQEHHAEPLPVLVVAAEGGGIRAAYWTASVLAYLEDEIEGFGCHLFAISGVSGGSLGGAIFAALVADRLANNEYTCAGDSPGSSEKLLPAVQKILDDDFLGPALAGMLFPDFTQRFLPTSGTWLSGALVFPDRATYLEKAWERSWRLGTAEAFGQTTDRLAEDFRRLWALDPLWVPALFLNGTWVENGARVVTSNLRADSPQFVKLDDVVRLLRRPMPLSTAVHMSARFTYVSPAGTIRYVEDGAKKRRRIVDGGYHENSGALTAAELVATIRRFHAETVRPVPVIVTNSKGEQDKGPLFLPETLSPWATLLNTRLARGYHADASLAREAPALRFQLRDVSDAEVPLGWMLSDKVRGRIDARLGRLQPQAERLGECLEGGPCTGSAGTEAGRNTP